MADAQQNAKKTPSGWLPKREIMLIGQLEKSFDVEEYIIPVDSWLYGLCECLFLEAVFHEVSIYSLSACTSLFLYYLS